MPGAIVQANEPHEADRPAWMLVGRVDDGIGVTGLDRDGGTVSREVIADDGFAQWVAERETAIAPRWVWSGSAVWYPPLLHAGVRVARCHDLRLCHAILRSSQLVADSSDLRAHVEWEADPAETVAPGAPTLFEWDEGTDAGRSGIPSSLADSADEFTRQRVALEGSAAPPRLRLLLAAESAGALIAAELREAGVPWDADEHDRILTGILGERPPSGGRPALLEAAAARVRAALGDPAASLDSQPKLLRALHRAGLPVESTSRWELSEHEHPVVEPLIEYKKLSRLFSANGWAWLAEWVADGRFRPVYIPGGVVTGRWASSGGGALQLPRQLRGAVRADPGWLLVSADVAQLEPRILAAMSGDAALAEAARGQDLYAGIVAAGAVETRQEAKIALLGAMYGATTGESGRLLPRLRRTYPRAMDLVDRAARTGEDGGVVSTWLGRTSPPPSDGWSVAQSRATEADPSGADVTRARRWARDRGRFTRNFVVQGTAAEWALAWLADLRTRLALMPETDAAGAAPRSGPAFATRPHLAFFLHDEVIVHAPADQAESVADAVVEAAAVAGRLLFGTFPIDFRLDVHVSQRAAKD